MAFNIPPYTSATLGTGFPSHGTLATPFVTTAPSLFKSTNSAYSIPDPNVPDAVITGFLNSTPAIFTFVFILMPMPFPLGPFPDGNRPKYMIFSISAPFSDQH
jgi:hypothetical protein